MPYDDFFLKIAFQEAQKAALKLEVPVGAVIVKDQHIIAKAHNLKESQNLATSHAEILAIQKASRKLQDWRLIDCTLYITLEPCPMCAGAIIQSRIKRVVYSALDFKWGAVQSKVELFKAKLFNHQVEAEYLPMEESRLLLKHFFIERRKSGIKN